MQYQAWVDQRSHDFLLVRSEAVRKVKEALDDAGVQMPVPMYHVDLGSAATGPGADTAVAPRVAKSTFKKTAARVIKSGGVKP